MRFILIIPLLAGILLLAACQTASHDALPVSVISVTPITEQDLPARVKSASESLRADGKTRDIVAQLRSDGHSAYSFTVEWPGYRNHLAYLDNGIMIDSRLELLPIPHAPLPAELSLTNTRHSGYGSLLAIDDQQHLALVLSCPVPTPLDRTILWQIGGDVSVRLALNDRGIRSNAVGGAAPPSALPSDFLDATSGTIEFSPTGDPNQVNVILRDVQFPGTRLKTFGPVTIVLNAPRPA